MEEEQGTSQKRLNRVDRLFDTLGEQQLTLSHHVCLYFHLYVLGNVFIHHVLSQDVTIQDLVDRLKIIEDSNRRDSDTLKDFRDARVFEKVDQLNDMVGKLQKQLQMHMREYQRHVGAEEERLGSMEDKLEMVCEDIVGVQEDVEHVHKDARQSVVMIVEKIAQQFDAMEESLRARDSIHEKHVHDVMGALEEMKHSQEEAVEDMKEEVIRRSRMVLDEARVCVEEKCTSLEGTLRALSECETSTSACVRDTVVPGLEDVRQALVHQQSSLKSLSDSMEQRMTECAQRECGVIGARTDDAMKKFTEYTSYVARLRNELRIMQDEFEGSRNLLMKKVTAELDSAEEHMTALCQHFTQQH